MGSVRVALADDSSQQQEILCAAIVELGHRVVGQAATGRELVDLCLQTKPELVITDVKMPDMDGLEALRLILESHLHASVVVSAYDDQSLLDRAKQSSVGAYLSKPFRLKDLRAAIELSLTRFAEIQAVTARASSLESQLNDRKVIERAKGVLMKQASIDEETAYRRLQRFSQESGQPMAEVARVILITASPPTS